MTRKIKQLKSFCHPKLIQCLGNIGDFLHDLSKLDLHDSVAHLLFEFIWMPLPDCLSDGLLDGQCILSFEYLNDHLRLDIWLTLFTTSSNIRDTICVLDQPWNGMSHALQIFQTSEDSR